MADDTALIILFPLAIILCIWSPWLWRKIMLFPHYIRQPKTSPFSYQNAYTAYKSYLSQSTAEFTHQKSLYNRSLSRRDKRIGYSVGYTQKLFRRDQLTAENAKVTEAIASLGSEVSNGIVNSASTHANLGRVREALKHLVRDWSSSGKAERQVIHEPILSFLSGYLSAHRKEGKKLRVLIPGAGLCRLPYAVSQLGNDIEVVAVEISHFMIMAWKYIASLETTNQHTIYPYAHWWSHQRTNENVFRGVSFPDILPSQNAFKLIEGDFNSIKDEYFDIIITLFFIDTSPNIISTIHHIHSLLTPQTGIWINLGPLLYPYEASVQLSLEEVFGVCKEVGFNIDSDSSRRKTIGCEYTADEGAMMRWIYKAEFFVCNNYNEN